MSDWSAHHSCAEGFEAEVGGAGGTGAGDTVRRRER
jgi:hypothetical protein